MSQQLFELVGFLLINMRREISFEPHSYHDNIPMRIHGEGGRPTSTSPVPMSVVSAAGTISFWAWSENTGRVGILGMEGVILWLFCDLPSQ